MTEKELKQLLKKAYPISPSLEEKRFLRNHEKRNMQMWDVLCTEICYIKFRSLIVMLLLCLLFYFTVRSRSLTFAWILSGSLPVCSLISLISLGKSEHYGMGELEQASRFSLKTIRLVRMLILGVFSLILLFLTGLVWHKVLQINILNTLTWVAVPYLFNVWSNLMLVRKWHGKENVYGCIVLSLISAITPTVIRYQQIAFSTLAVILVLLLLIVVTVKEGISFIKESEELWNLC